MYNSDEEREELERSRSYQRIDNEDYKDNPVAEAVMASSSKDDYDHVKAFKKYKYKRGKKGTYKKVKRKYPYARGARDVRKWLNAPEQANTRRNLLGRTWKEAHDPQKNLRRALRYSGDGDYSSFLKYIPRGVGAAAGGVHGYFTGGVGAVESGMRTGWNTGARASRYMGWGDYNVNPPDQGNQLMSSGGGGSHIEVNPLNQSGDIYYSHSEFVQNIIVNIGSNGMSPFELTKFPINPGLSSTFPFLSQLAQNFELYEFIGLIFRYVPLSGEQGSTGSNSLGSVTFATNYDSTAPDFINSVQMRNDDYANTCKPSVEMEHGVETKPMANALTTMYVRTGSSSKSTLFTDLGNFYVGTEGIAGTAGASQIIGMLEVGYMIRMSRANLYGSLLGNNIGHDNFVWNMGASAFISGSVVAKSDNTIGCVVSAVDSKNVTVTFPAGIILGAYHICGFASVDTAADNSVGPGIVLVNAEYAKVQVNTPTTTPVYWNAPATADAVDVSAYGFQMWIIVQAPGNAQAAFSIELENAIGSGSGVFTLNISQCNENMLLNTS